MFNFLKLRKMKTGETAAKQDEVSSQLATKPQGGRPAGGVNAAARDLARHSTRQPGAALSAAAKAEWLAEFRDDIGGWLSAETIEAAVDAGITARPPSPLFQYTGFVDPSGGARDSYTCAIAHQDGERAVLDCLVEVRPPFDPMAATQQIAAVLKSYRITSATGDRYAAQWVVGAFQQNDITYRHSDRDRSELYRDCLPLFTSGRARILDHRRLLSQFTSLERKTSSLGKDKIDHGPGGHDDLCNAAAGALVLATAQQRRGGLMFCGATGGDIYVDTGDGVAIIPDRASWSPATGGVTS